MKTLSELTENYDCTYCGERATCRDHVLPFSYGCSTKRIRSSSYSRKTCVPACEECNSLLSNFMYTSIAERALFLAGRLWYRHKDVLTSPQWSKEEYDGLSGNMLKHIKSLQTKKNLVKVRIEYARSVAEMTALTPEDVWGDYSSALPRHAQRLPSAPACVIVVESVSESISLAETSTEVPRPLPDPFAVYRPPTEPVSMLWIY